MWSNTYLSFTVGFPYLLWKVTLRTSSRGGGIGKHCSPTSTIPPKITTRPQNNYHSKLSENQAVWKSDNHGTEEVTFIQMDKRGGDAKWVVPHPCVVDKNWEGYLRSKQSTENQIPQPRVPVTGRWIPVPCKYKTSGGWGGRRNCRILRYLLLKGL